MGRRLLCLAPSLTVDAVGIGGIGEAQGAGIGDGPYAPYGLLSDFERLSAVPAASGGPELPESLTTAVCTPGASAEWPQAPLASTTAHRRR